MPKGRPFNVPKGFHRITFKGHSYFQCSKKKNVDGVDLFCMHKIRTDQYKPSKLIHICKFKPKNKEKNDELIQQNFIDTLFDYVGEKNLSIRTASSKIFRDILEFCYKFAQKHLDISFEQFFPRIGRSTFTEKFINRAKSIKEARLKEYSDTTYASLLLDAGSINKTPYITFVVARTDKKPIVFKNIRFFQGNSENYKFNVKLIVDELLNENNITITSFVADNLIAQKKALKSFFDSSINNFKFIKSKESGIIFCPCQCHTLSLAIKDLSKKNQFFKNLIQDIKDTIKFLRQKI